MMEEPMTSCFVQATEIIPDCVNAILYGVALTEQEEEAAQELYDLAKSYIEIYNESHGDTN